MSEDLIKPKRRKLKENEFYQRAMANLNFIGEQVMIPIVEIMQMKKKIKELKKYKVWYDEALKYLNSDKYNDSGTLTWIKIILTGKYKIDKHGTFTYVP